MFKSAIALIGLFASLSAFAANNVASEAQSLAYELRQNSAYLSDEQQNEIMKLLRAARAVIYAESPQDGGQYTCVSRDNDGQRPYVLGLRQGINVVRIQGTTFASMDLCKDAINTVRLLRNTALMCLSRDNDGQRPYQIATIDGIKATRISRSTTNSLEECKQLMNGLRFRQGQAQYCTSRDNDAQRPYVAASLDITTLVVRTGSETFNTMEECYNFLRN